MRGRWTKVAIFAGSVGITLTSVACSTSAESSQEAFPDPPVVTTFNRLAAEVTATGSVDLSLQLFALQFGALPEVPVPPDGEGPPTEANLAISAVFNVWDDITGSSDFSGV